MINEMKELNAMGGILEPCSLEPLTGFFRSGSCQAGKDNEAIHTVCVYATKEFLSYSKAIGNDLSTPMPQYNFPGVKEGDSWCVNAISFMKAVKDGIDVKIFIHSTHENILQFIDLESLKKYAIDL